MRFIHTSDLHLGRRLGSWSLEADQAHMLGQLLAIVEDSAADALVVAGDVYDSPQPSEWAVRLWDNFLTQLAHRGTPVLVVGGNHDSGARLACGSALMAEAGVYVAGELGASPTPTNVLVEGVRFWLVPFVRPADVRSWAAKTAPSPQDSLSAKKSMPPEISTYTQALSYVLDRARSQSDFGSTTNVCVAHQFVTVGASEPERSDSERLSLGTLDNVDSSAFAGFDYVALGHIHKPQQLGTSCVRYSGTPLKYSASEIGQHKGVIVVELDPTPGTRPRVERIPIQPLRDFRQVEGTMAELERLCTTEDDTHADDYMRAIVRDDNPLNVMERLRRLWPHMVEVAFDNASTQAQGVDSAGLAVSDMRNKSELFSAFFEAQAGRPLTTLEAEAVARAFAQAQEEGELLCVHYRLRLRPLVRISSARPSILRAWASAGCS